MSRQLNPEYSASFYHLSRHPELVVVKDRDVVAFIPDTAVLKPTDGMTIKRESDSITPLWESGTPNATEVAERLLLWARTSGTELSSGFRWVPYITSDDPTTTNIKPLREVFAPRVVYDRTSNSLHLWFWTNVKFDYNGTEYDENQIFFIGTADYPPLVGGTPQQCKRVLCHAVGQFGHYWIEGGYVKGFEGIPYGVQGTQGFQTFWNKEYDLVPLFTRPVIVTNYDADSESPGYQGAGPGLITDGWYGGDGIQGFQKGFQGFQGFQGYQGYQGFQGCPACIPFSNSDFNHNFLSGNTDLTFDVLSQEMYDCIDVGAIMCVGAVDETGAQALVEFEVRNF